MVAAILCGCKIDKKKKRIKETTSIHEGQTKRLSISGLIVASEKYGRTLLLAAYRLAHISAQPETTRRGRKRKLARSLTVCYRIQNVPTKWLVSTDRLDDRHRHSLPPKISNRPDSMATMTMRHALQKGNPIYRLYAIHFPRRLAIVSQSIRKKKRMSRKNGEPKYVRQIGKWLLHYHDFTRSGDTCHVRWPIVEWPIKSLQTISLKRGENGLRKTVTDIFLLKRNSISTMKIFE